MWPKNTDKFDQEFPECEIDKLFETGKKEILREIEVLMEKKSTDKGQKEIFHRWGQLREMLFHINERVNYWENRRTQFLQIGIGLLVGSIAGIIAIADNTPDIKELFEITQKSSWPFPAVKDWVFYFSLIICACYTIGCLILLMIWNSQNNPNYPFTKGYRIWLWHYRHAESKSIDTDFQKYSPTSFKQQIENFAENLLWYKKKILKSSDTELFDQDLSQVYLLLINEKFKIKMVNQLRDCLFRTTKIAFFLSISILIILGAMRALCVMMGS